MVDSAEEVEMEGATHSAEAGEEAVGTRRSEGVKDGEERRRNDEVTDLWRKKGSVRLNERRGKRGG